MKILMLAVLLYSSVELLADKEMEEITQKACECIENLESADMSPSLETIGMCMLGAAKDYEDYFQEVHGLSIGDYEDSAQMEKIGELIGIQMVSTCPKAMEYLVANTQAEEEVASMSASGEIVDIEKGQFVVFTVELDNGRTEKMYWIGSVESPAGFMENYEDLEGEDVIVMYFNAEVFDHRISEYRYINIIESINY